jgi:uncharacterized protein (TIGR03435 family)
VFAQAPAWERAAGGAMSFEVASIHLSDPDKFTPPKFPLDVGDGYAETGGRFSADFGLPVYFQFAYKISLSRGQMQTLLAHVPKWFSSDRFNIQAKAAIPNPTKDQMRLMVRALLAERFHLEMHFEMEDTSVFLLELAKPGKLGPNLLPHSEGPPCDKPDANAFPPRCDEVALNRPAGKLRVASRNTTIERIASAFPGMGGLDRPVIDRTGLTDRYDLKLEWVDDSRAPQPDGPPLADGLSFLQALREQLGLKLESAKVPLRVPVIDRVERPSEN